MPIRPNSPNSPNWPTAGGISKANSGRCTRSIRCAWTGSTASRRLPGKQVLDVGCGGGILADSMARKGAEVLGIDLADKALKVAQLHALEAGTRERQVPRGQRRGPGGRAAGAASTWSPAWRCWSTCPTRPRSCKACADAGQAGRLGVLLDHQPQPEVLPVRHRRRRIRAGHAAARHARVPEVHPPERTGRATAAPPASICATRAAWSTTR